jgi:hypothetical protein
MAQLPARIILAMPTPGSPNAPHFKGQRVTDFLESLEAHATAANVVHNDLPAFVLRYCHRRVRNTIDSSTHWALHDWTATRAYLTDLCGSNDQKPRTSPDRLRKWVKLHADNRSIVRLQDVDKYYRSFTAQSAPLVSAGRITQNETNILFYRGIPSPLRKKIKHKIPTANRTVTAALTVTSVLGYLRDEFSIDNIDDDPDDTSDFVEDSASEMDDGDFGVVIKIPRTPKKVKPDARQVSTNSNEPPLPTAYETLAKQIEDFKVQQAALPHEINAVNTPCGSQTYEKRCFICDFPNVHPLGPCNCPEVPLLVKEGLVNFNQMGRLMRPDGSDLPHGLYGGGGVAKALRDERLAQTPSMSKSSGFQYHGTDSSSNAYTYYSSSALSSTLPASHLQDRVRPYQGHVPPSPTRIPGS